MDDEGSVADFFGVRDREKCPTCPTNFALPQAGNATEESAPSDRV